MKRIQKAGYIIFLQLTAMALPAYEAPTFPYAPAAGEAGSTAVAYDDREITGWATGVSWLQYGEDVAEEWRQPEGALGPVDPGAADVLVLGRGGSVVLEFHPAIVDGKGPDFAVFENSFSSTFLELAYVEVSSDGEHFVRFPNYSQTLSPVPGFGQLDPTLVHGFAGKYKSGFGTPFDLSELMAAHAALLDGYAAFSPEFSGAILANFPLLDLQSIRYVRLVDIPGDGAFDDCEGFAIYDPYPTIISAGFDLDGVGVLNQGALPPVSFAAWSSSYGLPAIADADGDGDGWGQYMEYLFASSPILASSQPSMAQAVGSTGEYTLVYWKSLPVTGQLSLQFSTDGETWVDALSHGVVELLEVDNLQGVALEQFSLADPPGQFFLRFTAGIPGAGL
jgi:hypothetical protein